MNLTTRHSSDIFRGFEQILYTLIKKCIMTAHITSMLLRHHDDGKLLPVHSQGHGGAAHDQRGWVSHSTLGVIWMSGVWHPSVLDGEHGTAMAPWFVATKVALSPPKTQMWRAVYASNLNHIFYTDLNISMFELPAGKRCSSNRWIQIQLSASGDCWARLTH